MKTIEECATEFIQELSSAENQLATAHAELGQREERIQEALSRFREDLPDTSSEERVSAELRDLASKTIDALVESMDAWNHEVANQLAAREFVDQFDRSLIVIVYGKVKSGKSTLGNFIAGLDFPASSNDPYSQHTVDMRIHDTADKSRKIDRMQELKDGFEVKATEATNCIQAFTLGALTWVDTPGIDAMTEANVALAHEYVRNAELAVYLTSSDSPMRAGDLEALKGLLQRKIPTVIVVSKFDENVEDIDPETQALVSELRVKSELSRTQQKDWIEQRISEAGLEGILEDRSYVFLSTQLAKEAASEADVERFHESGIPDLYEKLARILSEDAVRFKQDAPKKKLNALVDQILERGVSVEPNSATENDASIQAWRSRMARLRERSEANRSSVMQRQKSIAKAVQNKLERPLREILLDAERLYEKGKYDEGEVNQRVADAVESVLRETVSQELQKRAEEAVHDVVDTISPTGSADIQVGSIETLREIILVPDNAIKEGVGGATGSTIGAGVGWWLGSFVPIIGNAIGAMIGGAVGGYVGGKGGQALSGEKELDVDVGTNIDALRQQLNENLGNMIPGEVNSMLEQFCSVFYVPIIDSIREVETGLKKLDSEIKELRYEDV